MSSSNRISTYNFTCMNSSICKVWSLISIKKKKNNFSSTLYIYLNFSALLHPVLFCPSSHLSRHVSASVGFIFFVFPTGSIPLPSLSIGVNLITSSVDTILDDSYSICLTALCHFHSSIDSIIDNSVSTSSPLLQVHFFCPLGLLSVVYSAILRYKFKFMYSIAMCQSQIIELSC